MATRPSAPIRRSLGCVLCSTRPTALPSLVSAQGNRHGGLDQLVLIPFNTWCFCCRCHSNASLRTENSQYSCFSHNPLEHNAVTQFHSCCTCAEQLLPQFQQYHFCPKPKLFSSQLYAATHRTNTCWCASCCKSCSPARASLFPIGKYQPQLREHKRAGREGELKAIATPPWWVEWEVRCSYSLAAGKIYK